MAKILNDVDMDKESEQEVKKGSKQELLNYIVKEIGDELFMTWNTELFYMEAFIKTAGLGSVIR